MKLASTLKVFDFKQGIYFGLPSCLRCGSVTANSSQFCPWCYQNILMRFGGLRKKSLATEFPVFYFFNWIPQESDSLSLLIGMLKGHTHPLAWRYYAFEFWRSIVKNGHFLPQNSLALVPIPSKKSGTVDHAYLFCLGLSEASGIPILNMLAWPNQPRRQKEKSRRDRMKTSLILNEKFSGWSSKRQSEKLQIILVDDVCTTGSTLSAAKEALNNWNVSGAWVLSYRAFGCSSKVNLL